MKMGMETARALAALTVDDDSTDRFERVIRSEIASEGGSIETAAADPGDQPPDDEPRNPPHHRCVGLPA